MGQRATLTEQSTARQLLAKYRAERREWEAAKALADAIPDLLDALRGLLNRVENMTTEEYSCGGDKAEREAARAAIRKVEGSKERTDP